MIRIYDKKANKNTVLNTNGLAVLDNICIEAKIKESLNEEYGLSCIFVIDEVNKKHEFIVEEAILKVPELYGDQVFRISQITKRADNFTIEVYARQITYDVKNLFVENAYCTGIGGDFLIGLFNAITTPHDIEYMSNIIDSSQTTTYKYTTVHDALFNESNSFRTLFGYGDVGREGYRISLQQFFGIDNGITITNKKNLRGFESHIILDDVVTRIYPFGANAITIPEKYIDSPLINNYATIKFKKVEFTDIKVSDTVTLAQAQQMLRDRVNKMYSVDEVDKIRAEYNVDFIDISNTEQYKKYGFVGFEGLGAVGIGDVIHVYEEIFNITVAVRVTERVFNIITRTTENITLSNILKKTVYPLRKISTTLNKIIDQESGYALTKNKHHSGNDEPSTELGKDGDIYIKY